MEAVEAVSRTRSYRRHQRERVIEARAADVKGMHGFNRDKQRGRWAKQHPLDCGHTQCWMCHSDKNPDREPTAQERAADEELKEAQENQ